MNTDESEGKAKQEAGSLLTQGVVLVVSYPCLSVCICGFIPLFQ
jgi:hypothetical protein